MHELAGRAPTEGMLTNIPRLMTSYFGVEPDVREPTQRVEFGTSGHRGTAGAASFNEAHIVAVSSAICDYREAEGITGPLFLGMDTHALSEAAHTTAIEVLAARGVELRVSLGLSYTPTPAISHAILTHNRGGTAARADGVVITPSHNPPEDGGFKYNPPTGGPADTGATKVIEKRANELLANWKTIRRIPLRRALGLDTTQEYDYVTRYVEDLSDVVDLAVVAQAGVRIGVDPLGGAAVHFWEPIGERYNVKLEVVNSRIDPTFSFMRVDKDGKIRMDCSSPYAMAGLIEMRERFDISFANDPDADRHGVVTRSRGLLNPNHYLAVAIRYLFANRPGWSADAGIGKTLVSSSMIDRVAGQLGRRLEEVPVGFKWFVDGLLTGRIGFGGEESAGASFLRKGGGPWSTDKDGLILNLLAAEILAKTGRDPGEHYGELEQQFGSPVYKRIDAPADPRQKAILKELSPEAVKAESLAGEEITAKLTRAPANDAPIGGLKVSTENGWFAARPSGTENIYKIYAESFIGEDHLNKILAEAQQMVDAALNG